MFQLEALQAKHGDALLLHYGAEATPKFILVDGGPSRVYGDTLRSRLCALPPDLPLELQLVMVSHIDDDHINGILDLTTELRRNKENHRESPFFIKEIWFNGFDDLVTPGRTADLAAGSVAAAAQLASHGQGLHGLKAHGPGTAVLASVNQGRTLRDNIQFLQLALNQPFGGGLVQAPAAPVNMGDGLTLKVLGPSGDRLVRLQDEWDKQIVKKKIAKDANRAAELAAFTDGSVYNLASIIVLAEMDDKCMLLTGDARGDDILDALEPLMDGDDSIHLDLLKVPHHGSDRNVSTEFFRRVRADHYVISADGRHHNPEPAMLKMLLDARRGDEFTIHFTNYDQALHTAVFTANNPGDLFKVAYREHDNPSILIPLS